MPYGTITAMNGSKILGFLVVRKTQKYMSRLLYESMELEYDYCTSIPCSADHERDWPSCKVVLSGWQPLR